MRSFMSQRISPRAVLTATLALALSPLAGCGTLKQRAEAVQITATRTEVADCRNVGPVLLGTFDTEFDQRQRDLRFETARKGGNVLLVESFATSTTGTAYVCDQPVHPDRTAS